MRLLVAVIFCALVARLVGVQELSHQHYAALSTSELSQTVTVPAVRGGIYDRNGEVLAETVTRQTVVGDPLLITRPVPIADALAPLLGIPATTLRTELTGHSQFVYLAHRVSDAVAAEVTKLALPGINLIPEAQRVVPVGHLAEPVVGSVDWAGNGAAGLEYQYQSLLAGTPGSTDLLRSPGGVVLPGGERTVPSVPAPGSSSPSMNPCSTSRSRRSPQRWSPRTPAPGRRSSWT